MTEPVPAVVPPVMGDVDAAAYLATLEVHISPATIRSWRSFRFQRGPRYTKQGHYVLYARADLEAWAKSRNAYKFREPVELA